MQEIQPLIQTPWLVTLTERTAEVTETQGQAEANALLHPKAVLIMQVVVVHIIILRVQQVCLYYSQQLI